MLNAEHIPASSNHHLGHDIDTKNHETHHQHHGILQDGHEIESFAGLKGAEDIPGMVEFVTFQAWGLSS
jgi:hypothetical protein